MQARRLRRAAARGEVRRIPLHFKEPIEKKPHCILRTLLKSLLNVKEPIEGGEGARASGGGGGALGGEHPPPPPFGL
jgi:hypothetical protein